MQSAINKGPKVEAYGVKGMKSTPWRKVFKNAEALSAWCDKNDAVMHAMRALPEAGGDS